jgi:hypothetical protein
VWAATVLRRVAGRDGTAVTLLLDELGHIETLPPSSAAAAAAFPAVGGAVGVRAAGVLPHAGRVSLVPAGG